MTVSHAPAPAYTKKTDYRPDIDGLRAVSVLLVLLFHLEIWPFHGGFIGVDVFFVISGYLITSLLMKDIEVGSFSFKAFYLRRLRRLFPAFLATLALSLACAAIWLHPPQMQQFGMSLFFAVAALSNGYFWIKADYFDLAATQKPLLHTWTLSAEEQFYLFWPAFLLVLWMLAGRKMILFGTILAGALSLWAAMIVTPVNFDAAFYLTPFRIYEFVIGAGCVWLMRFAPKQRWLRDMLCGLGLAMIMMAGVTFSDLTPFPGYHALLPCLGAALVIVSGTGLVTGAMLRNPVSIGLGQISYSLYLLHWPAIIFYNQATGDMPAGIWSFVLAGGSILAAYLMFRFIETPFRKPRPAADGGRASNRRFVLTCAFMASLLMCLGLNAWKEKGWYWRLPAEIGPLVVDVEGSRRATWERYRAIRDQERPADAAPPDAVLIGDSYAKDVLNAMTLAGSHLDIYPLQTSSHCQPVVGRLLVGMHPRLRDDTDIEGCEQRIGEILHNQELERVDLIMIAASWKGYGIERMRETIQAIRNQNADADIIVFGQRMTFQDVPTLAIEYGQLDGLADYINDHQLLDQSLIKRERLLEELSGLDIYYVDFVDILCPEFNCPMLSDDQLTYLDGGHWSLEGAKLYGEIWKQSGDPAAQLVFAD